MIDLAMERIPSHSFHLFPYTSNYKMKQVKIRTLASTPFHYLLMQKLSQLLQAPVVPQVVCHSVQVLSMSAPKRIGPGMVPRSRTTIHCRPRAKDRWLSGTHLQEARKCSVACERISLLLLSFGFISFQDTPAGVFLIRLRADFS